MSEKGKTPPPKAEHSAVTQSEDVPADTAATPFALDLDRLLTPISPEQPAGVSLRYEGTYDQIQDARRADDADIPQGVWERGLKKADWKQVYTLCTDALQTRTKDLQIAVWLLEALLHLRGFAGVQASLGLMHGLCEQFWDDLHPPLEGDDVEGRVAPLVWMNEKLSVDLKLIPITMPHAVDAVAYTFADWEVANRLENLAQKDRRAYEKAEAEGRATRAKFLGSVMFSSREFYIRQAEALGGAVKGLADLNSLLDQKCGQDGPSFRYFSETLTAIEGLATTFLKEKQGERGEPDQDSAEAAEGGQEEPDGEGPVCDFRINNRSDAYRMLSSAADYLLIHEPHSPTPYLVKRAVSWGHMTLMELLQELINDRQDLGQIYKLLGLRGLDEE